jgi:hypothetical protein
VDGAEVFMDMLKFNLHGDSCQRSDIRNQMKI